MATWINLLRSSARYDLKCQDLAANICLPTIGATPWPVTPLRQGLGGAARLFCSSNVSDPKPAKDWPGSKSSYREGLELTDDILNSDAKLHALFLRWLSKQDHYHFDVEDEKAFRKRFEIFKETARDCHQHNKTGSSYSQGVTCFADLTHEEWVTRSWKIYPKKLTTTGKDC